MRAKLCFYAPFAAFAWQQQQHLSDRILTDNRTRSRNEGSRQNKNPSSHDNNNSSNNRKTRFHQQQQQTRLDAHTAYLAEFKAGTSGRYLPCLPPVCSSARLPVRSSPCLPVCFDNLTLLIESHDGDNSNLCTSCSAWLGCRRRCCCCGHSAKRLLNIYKHSLKFFL